MERKYAPPFRYVGAWCQCSKINRRSLPSAATFNKFSREFFIKSKFKQANRYGSSALLITIELNNLEFYKIIER